MKVHTLDTHVLIKYTGGVNSFFNDVNDWLSVGGDLDLARDLTGQDYAVTIAQLRDHGVTHVLDLRSEWEDRAEWVAAGMEEGNYRHAPIEDSWRHIPAESWYQAVEDFVRMFWVDSFDGDRLYVHCHMGINRAPSAAMLALLTIGEEIDPWVAFLRVREARPAAGLVYAEAVGARHIIQSAADFTDEWAEIDEDSVTFARIEAFSKTLEDYWTPGLIKSVNRGIAYYRSAEGGTTRVQA